MQFNNDENFFSKKKTIELTKKNVHTFSILFLPE